MRNAYKMLIRKPHGKKPLGDLGVNGRIILKWSRKNMGVSKGVYWSQLARDRIQWRAVVKTFRLRKKWGIS
jgi:hypothetical protein